MGCLPSSLSVPKRPMITPVHVGQYLNHPSGSGQGNQAYAERGARAAKVSKEVARCAGLLRQMYALELSIWGMDENVADEMPRMEEMKKKANAIFTEVRSIVCTWSPTARGGGGMMLGWSPEEEEHVIAISNIINQHGSRRYEDVV